MARRTPSSVPSLVIDIAAGRVTVDDTPVELRPKTWEVLRYLVERAGQLVGKDELFDAVWADTAVSESTLSKSVGELRSALDDSSQSPRFLETVSRRGFRWIGPVKVVGGAVADQPGGVSEPSAPAATGAAADEGGSGVIARDRELGELEAALSRARAGRRQVLFVTGEAGAGKTTLVDRFLERIRGASGTDAVLVAHGQCIETSGQHEPYLPVFDALDRLARDRASGQLVLEALRRCAPTWVAQMPSLAVSPASAPAATGVAPGRMLRELTTAIDEIASQETLVLVLEDAHWADLATTDACSALARQRDGARLLVLVTMRTAEAMVLEHPVVALSRDLVARRAAEEIALVSFGREALDTYLASRCPGLGEHDGIADWLLHQTAGNPLFVRLVVDDWVSRGVVARSPDGRWSLAGDVEDARRTVPDSLRALLERQVEQLSADERGVLEAASVHLGDFHAASIAAATGRDAEEVEDACLRIVRRGQLLRSCGRIVTADGLVTEQFAFLHATVQRVIADDLPSTRRRRLHLAAAEQLEREYAGRTRAVSSQLAVHYEAAGDVARAVRNLRDSAKAAMRRDSPRDAILTLEHALALIDQTPSFPDRDGERVLALSSLGHAHQLVYGFVSPKVEALWSRTRDLATSSDDARGQVLAHAGSIMVSCVSARYADGEEVIRKALPLLPSVEDEGSRQALMFSAATVRYRIAALDDAASLFDAALALKDSSDTMPGADVVALLQSQYAPVLVLQGRVDEARRLVDGSLARARAHSHYSVCVTSAIAAWALAMLHDFSAAAPIAARALEIAEADGYRTWSTRPLFLLGMSAIQEGRVEQGSAQVRAALEGRASDGQVVDQSSLLCLYAEGLMNAGREGWDEILDQAADFVAGSGELYCECEIYRLKAKSRRLAGGHASEVEADLRRSLELAALRGMHWHALLASSDLAALMIGQGRAAEVPSLLEPACAAIAGGNDLPAMRTARELLARAAGTA